MTNLARIDSNALAIGQRYGYDAVKMEALKQLIAPETTDAELELFLYTAYRTGLDPFARQIYCIRRTVSGKKVATIQTSIDGYRLIADRTGDYVPGREPTFDYTPDGEVASATAYVLKWKHGTWHEIAATAFYDEYVQLSNGSPTMMWEKKPRLMLAKCAESLALRRAFPAEMSGLYTDSELPQDVAVAGNVVTSDIPTNVNVITGEVIESPPAPAPPTSDRDRMITKILRLAAEYATREPTYVPPKREDLALLSQAGLVSAGIDLARWLGKPTKAEVAPEDIRWDPVPSPPEPATALH